MFCKKCGKQLKDGALFCTACGQRTGNQMYNTEAPVQPNVYPVYPVNPAGNTISEKTAKKKPVVPIVVSIVSAIIIIGIGCFFWFRPQLSNDVDTGAEVSSLSDRGESDVSTSSQTSVEELLGYIDQAQNLMSKTIDDVDALTDGEDWSEMFRKQIDVLEKALSDLSDLQKQADMVSGIDANLENAKKEYFSMASDSLKAYGKTWNFFTDFYDLAIFLDSRPVMEEYSFLEDYYNDLNAWSESAKEGYAAIDSCPPSLESAWKQLEDIIELNDSIVLKLFFAEQYNDWLRYYSAQNMSNRYDTVLGLQIDELMNGIESEADFFGKQMELSFRLAEEMHVYAELEEEKRSGYEFEFARAGEVNLDYDAVDTIYPSLYNTYDAFLIIKTGCISGVKTIVVEAEIPGFTQNFKESFTLDSAYRTIYIKPPALAGNLDLSSAKDAQINITVTEQDGTLIEAKTFPLTIKSKYDFEWYTDEYGVATQDNILCFLTPESAAISVLKRQAIEEISDITGGQMEYFAGYQESTWNNYVTTYLQVAGIMRAMYEMGVRYNMDPFSISGSNQHILLPEEVLEQKSGLCVETSLVVASALQSAGMHAFLIFPPGHAQVAVEVWNDGEGVGEYFLIETTALTGNSNNQDIFIENANALLNYEVLGTGPIIYYNQDEWYAYLAENVEYIIDCDDSSVLGLTPFAN